MVWQSAVLPVEPRLRSVVEADLWTLHCNNTPHNESFNPTELVWGNNFSLIGARVHILDVLVLQHEPSGGNDAVEAGPVHL